MTPDDNRPRTPVVTAEPACPRFSRRFRIALMPAIGFALACAVLFCLAGAIGLYLKGFALLPRSGIAIAVLALPPALAAGLVAYAIDILMPRRSAWLGGIGMAAAIATLGPVASAGAFSLQYRYTYPVAYEPLWTEIGFHQFAWTGIATIVLFGLHGLPLYWPWALPAVLLAAFYFARRPVPSLQPVSATRRDRIEPAGRI